MSSLSSLSSIPSPTAAIFNPSNPSSKRSSFTVSAVAGKIRYKGTAMRERRLSEMIEVKIAEAMAACDGDEEEGEGKRSDGCKVAWDEVEEVSQAKAHLRTRLALGLSDPLESFCEVNPDSDECVICDA